MLGTVRLRAPLMLALLAVSAVVLGFVSAGFGADAPIKFGYINALTGHSPGSRS